MFRNASLKTAITVSSIMMVFWLCLVSRLTVQAIRVVKYGQVYWLVGSHRLAEYITTVRTLKQGSVH